MNMVTPAGSESIAVRYYLRTLISRGNIFVPSHKTWYLVTVMFPNRPSFSQHPLELILPVSILSTILNKEASLGQKSAPLRKVLGIVASQLFHTYRTDTIDAGHL
jgi:hypothetical protein